MFMFTSSRGYKDRHSLLNEIPLKTSSIHRCLPFLALGRPHQPAIPWHVVEGIAEEACRLVAGLLTASTTSKSAWHHVFSCLLLLATHAGLAGALLWRPSSYQGRKEPGSQLVAGQLTCISRHFHAMQPGGWRACPLSAIVCLQGIYNLSRTS